MGKKQKNTDSISLGRRIRNGKSSYLFLLPFMILFFVFTVLPVLGIHGFELYGFQYGFDSFLCGYR